MKKLKTITSILIIQAMIAGPAWCIGDSALCGHNMPESTLGPRSSINTGLFYSIFQDLAFRRSEGAHDEDIFLKQIRELGSQSMVINQGEQAQKLWKFFQKNIAPLNNKDKFLKQLLDEIENLWFDSFKQKKLVQILELFFSDTCLEQEKALFITSEQVDRLWEIYGLLLEYDATIIKSITNILIDKRITISDDVTKKKAKSRFKKEFAEFFKDSVEKFQHGAPYGSIDFADWTDLFIRCNDQKFFENMIDCVKPLEKENVSMYRMFMLELLRELPNETAYKKKTVLNLVLSSFDLYASSVLDNSEDAWDSIFENDANARKFFSLATHLRMAYPYALNKKDPRSPLRYALEEGIFFKIGKNLYISPVTESFRRHIIFGKDGRGNISFAFEVVIPGFWEHKRDVWGRKRYDMALETLSELPECCVEPFKYKEFNHGIYEVYGKKFDFNQDCRLNIVGFEYIDIEKGINEDGKRLSNFTPEMLDDVSRQLDIPREALDIDIASQAAVITAAIHGLGYSGSWYYEVWDWEKEEMREMLATDHRAENFRLIISNGKVKIKLVGDFTSYVKHDTADDKDSAEEMEKDIQGFIGDPSGKKNTGTFKRLLNSLSIDKLTYIFREAYHIKLRAYPLTNRKVLYFQAKILIEQAI